MYTHDELVWLAGFLDGDGCFTAAEKSGVFIRVAHTHKPTLDFITKTFGGSLHEHNHGRPKHYKQVWRWAICGDEAKDLAINLIPYLREKRPQAELLVDILALRTGRGNRQTAEHKALRNKLVQHLKDLKYEGKRDIG